MAVKWRTIVDQDLEKVMNWRMLPEVSKYMYSDPSLTLESQRRWYKSISADETCEYWIVSVDDIDVGVVCFTNINKIHSRCDWGYYIADNSFKGRGLGTILECNIYDHGFDDLELHKLCCEVFCENSRVIDIHKKFGSEVEGVRRQHIYKNGEFHDIAEMAITNERWQTLKENFNYTKVEFEAL